MTVLTKEKASASSKIYKSNEPGFLQITKNCIQIKKFDVHVTLNTTIS